MKLRKMKNIKFCILLQSQADLLYNDALKELKHVQSLAFFQRFSY